MSSSIGSMPMQHRCVKHLPHAPSLPPSSLLLAPRHRQRLGQGQQRALGRAVGHLQARYRCMQACPLSLQALVAARLAAAGAAAAAAAALAADRSWAPQTILACNSTLALPASRRTRHTAGRLCMSLSHLCPKAADAGDGGHDDDLRRGGEQRTAARQPRKVSPATRRQRMRCGASAVNSLRYAKRQLSELAACPTLPPPALLRCGYTARQQL